MKAKDKPIRVTFHLTGIVQGVGFRPALARLAGNHKLTGSARNMSGKVELILEGTAKKINAFISALPHKLPPNAQVESLTRISTQTMRSKQSPTFTILPSKTDSLFNVVIPADLAMCPDCRREVFNPENRRYGYPFTTCTACGPRYTIINQTPYDRSSTTMASFPMCRKCLAEYNDPDDRRYHAETLACPDCGPTLSFHSNSQQVSGFPAILSARRLLADGGILAVKGIGGFLLAVDSTNSDGISTLRKRKQRPHKPFAVMAPDIETVRRICHLPDPSREILTSPSAPIVILDTREKNNFSNFLPLNLITPQSNTLGIMLPTSPLHLLLLSQLQNDTIPPFKLLIMTSGNRRGEPVCITNDQAMDRLTGIADAFLLHNREINLRNDDSVGAIQSGGFQLWRRARGYAPGAIKLPCILSENILAMGGKMKNTIALAIKDRVYMSPHIGNLDTPEAIDGLKAVTKNLPGFLHIKPEHVAVDLHPDMQSTILGRQIAKLHNLRVTEIQHHHAHAMAGLIENNLTEGLAIALDGTGLGTDGTIWGAEVLEVNLCGFQRLATFVPESLPGGDYAIIEPIRQLVARLHSASIDIAANLPAQYNIKTEQIHAWLQQAESGLNSPLCHSAGRLLDSFACFLGIAPEKITYDGQPAIHMETIARQFSGIAAPSIPFETNEKNNMLMVDWRPAFRYIASLSQSDNDKTALAYAIHSALSSAAVEMIKYALTRTSHRNVILTGGVFMNKLITSLTLNSLKELGIKPYIHRKMPPNDACIALGQSVLARIDHTFSSRNGSEYRQCGSKPV